MNKLICYIVCLFCFALHAQETLPLINTNKSTSPYTEKDIKVDDSTLSIRHFPKNFKESYTSRDFQYEIKIAQKGLWDRFLEWLGYCFQKIFGFTDTKTAGKAVSITLQIIAIAIIGYVIYVITKLILNKEGQWVFGKSTTKKVIEFDDIEQNLKHVDFENLIKDTLKSGDKRLAIRFYYLWILKKMSEKNIIEWNAEKTNSDYLYEIQGQNLKKEFTYLSYLYNYIWYGEFDLDEAAFDQAKAAFENTLKSIY